ncbi:alpha/beta fold hydrolase [Sphingomonas sp. H39-1-10]|uniref:alpha/beta fold hydrolase n=1 Tax=Sphingomonas pollutisoli TaxID=3030829 RepID=UPI0023B8D539|nr:alpha/beta fold hydrolase [Sphingomonas pollutisoli]MDF0487848.1 alpha/beta fold hydrolase [Sphingomonas pollutisoli]
MKFAEHEIELEGSTMNVLVAGTGPTVLLGHSYLFDSRMWSPQLEALSARYRVVAPDMWGHGRSGKMPADTRDIADLARQHLSLMDYLAIDRCAVIGLSLGGMWAAELALMAPERVSALVMMDTSLAAEPAPSRDAYFGMLAAVEQAGVIPPPVVATALDMFFSPAIDTHSPGCREDVATRLRTWNSARLLDSVVPLGRMTFGRREALAALSTLTMPTLVATGADDKARPAAEGRAMAEQIGCRFSLIPDAGHIANLEAPDYVERLLLDFLAEALA